MLAAYILISLVWFLPSEAFVFPCFVRDLGRIWYKMRKFFPCFVRDLGRIWYKVRKVFPSLYVI